MKLEVVVVPVADVDRAAAQEITTAFRADRVAGRVPRCDGTWGGPRP